MPSDMNHVERFKESIMIGIASIVGVFLKILLDEKTDPYTIHGNNVEDDYGFMGVQQLPDTLDRMPHARKPWP